MPALRDSIARNRELRIVGRSQPIQQMPPNISPADPSFRLAQAGSLHSTQPQPKGVRGQGGKNCAREAPALHCTRRKHSQSDSSMITDYSGSKNIRLPPSHVAPIGLTLAIIYKIPNVEHRRCQDILNAGVSIGIRHGTVVI